MRHPSVLAVAGGWMFAMQFLDVYWQVMRGARPRSGMRALTWLDPRRRPLLSAASRARGSSAGTARRPRFRCTYPSSPTASSTRRPCELGYRRVRGASGRRRHPRPPAGEDRRVRRRRRSRRSAAGGRAARKTNTHGIRGHLPEGASPRPAGTSIAHIEQTPLFGAASGLELRRRQREELSRYHWVDRDAGLAAIPIERAMDLVVQPEGR